MPVSSGCSEKAALFPTPWSGDPSSLALLLRIWAVRPSNESLPAFPHHQTHPPHPRTRMHTLVHTCTQSHSPTCTPSPGVLWTRLLPAPTLLAGVSQLKPRGSSSQSLLIQRRAPEGRQAGEQGGGPAGVSGSVLRTLLQQLLCGEKRIS